LAARRRFSGFFSAIGPQRTADVIAFLELTARVASYETPVSAGVDALPF
jgi:hypothetical protein